MFTFRRKENKYLITPKQHEALLALVQEHLTDDPYGESTVCNIYLDTPSHFLIGESIDVTEEGRPYKEKLRIRSYGIPGDAKQIVSIFLAVASGLACACGYVALAVLFTLIVAAIMCLIATVPMADDRKLMLQVLVPENLNYMTDFDDLFAKYTKKHGLSKVKTTQMGSLYKLYYGIEMKDGSKIKEFMDEIRCRNGNLEVMICSLTEGAEEQL